MEAHERIPRWLSILVIVLVAWMYLLLPIIPVVGAVSANPGLFSIHSKPYGLPYAQWAADWWRWFYRIPQDNNPAADKTGVNCGVQQTGPVWFLAGTTGGAAERACTVPAGKAIFFPIIASECSYAEYPSLKSASDLQSCATAYQNGVKSLIANIDGVPIKNLTGYRVVTGAFPTVFPQGNVAGVSPGSSVGYADGNYVFLTPLPPGNHDISFSGSEVNPTPTGINSFAISTIYHLSVK